MLTRLFTLFAGLAILAVQAQEFSVAGKVVDANTDAVAYANILLIKASDSTTVGGTYTEEDGSFLFQGISSDSYILRITYLGYAELVVPIEENSDTDLGILTMDEVTEGLDEVSVIARRPTLVRDADRLVFNVSNTALIEGNILQVVKSTPSLIVLDNEIRIKNTVPEIYVNNRKIRLSSAELMDFLESAPANSIKSIEVITNPPASFDASSGMVVNIIMDKNLIAGYRGSVAAGFKQGVFPNHNASTSHFFRGEKSGFNLNYGYSNDKVNRENDDVVNYFDNQNNIDEVWNSDIKRVTDSETHTLSLNYDYEFDERNTINLASSALYLPYTNYNIKNNTPIFDNGGNFQSRFIADSETDDDKYNISTDLDFTHRFRNDASLKLNAHLTLYDFERFQFVRTTYFDSSDQPLLASRFHIRSHQDTEIYSSKIDYSLPINESSNFETGAKFSYVEAQSDIILNNIVNGEEIFDETNSDNFNYKEKIFAAYANFSTDWDKWSLNLGLRAEYTDLIGVSSSENLVNEQDYLKWFPNASLLYQISDNVNVRTNYKRSIQRPDYRVLTPFQFFLNENIIVAGNPGLQPIITDHVVLGTDFLGNFTFEAYYKSVEDKIYELPFQNNENNTITYTPVNVDKTIEFGFDLLYQKSILDNWFLTAVTSVYYQEDENELQGQLVQINQWSNFSSIQNSLSFLKDRSLNLDFSLVFISKYIDILAKVEPRLFSDLSISKEILDGNGALSLSAGDLFNTQDPRAVTRYLNQSSIYDSDLDNRFVQVGFRYKFGNTKLKTNARTITTDEDRRLKEN